MCGLVGQAGYFFFFFMVNKKFAALLCSFSMLCSTAPRTNAGKGLLVATSIFNFLGAATGLTTSALFACGEKSSGNTIMAVFTAFYGIKELLTGMNNISNALAK